MDNFDPLQQIFRSNGTEADICFIQGYITYASPPIRERGKKG
jgi:hypothetical protein